MRLLFNIPFAAKFGGATGNYNAHHVAYPQIDWRQFEVNLWRHFRIYTRSNYSNRATSFCCFFDSLKELILLLSI
jgi:adenylosuccinate lyase